MQIFFCFFNLGGIYLVIIYLKHPSGKHRLSDQKKRKKNKYKGRLYTKMTKARKKKKKKCQCINYFCYLWTRILCTPRNPLVYERK